MPRLRKTESLLNRENMPNLFLFILEPNFFLKFNTSLNAGKMYMNRFLIDEDASFELSGVYLGSTSSGTVEDQKTATGKVN